MRRIFAFTLALILVSSTAYADIGDNAVGMNVHDGRQSFVDACADLGVQWVRVDGNWVILEPQDDQYNWGYLDDAVAAANDAGINVFMTLGYNPAWVPRTGDTDGEPGNDIPDTAAWTDFVTAAVNHFRPMGVTHYGMWNEANLTHFFEGSAQQYADVIAVPGAAAVRAACDDCLVLGPELANVGDADDFLEEVLTHAGTQTFDIITHHSYNGFPELGTQIYDGDRFFNVLDQQRFPFTRRSLRQVLDQFGWTGEVWITETGYRTDPVDDATEEERQATYYELVLEEQLKRGWYTNTFFYEIHDCGIDQPDCDIDGFGIMRATAGSPGSRSFPADFRTKPAYDTLKDTIANTPSFQGGGPPVCGNGEDDDGDGRADLDDRGCADAADDDESDDPPRPRVEVTFGAATVDGDLGDWADADWLVLDTEDWRGTEALDLLDLRVRFSARWQYDGIYLAFEVTDEAHVNDHEPENLWQGDSVQIAFDVGHNGGVGYDDVDDHEINFALTDGGPSSYRFHGPEGASDAWEFAIARDGSQTGYEIFLGADVLPSLTLEQGSMPAFSFLVNDDDGDGREGWMEWTPGIGNGKEPYWFGELLLQPFVTPGSDAGLPDDNFDAGGDRAPDLGTVSGDVGSGVDAASAPDEVGGSDGGCQCSSAAASSTPWFAALLALLFCAAKRPRRFGV
jgi:MYXO-CTERM domain-containing protein